VEYAQARGPAPLRPGPPIRLLPRVRYGLVLYLAASEPCPECGGAVEADIGITPEGELVEGLMLLRNPT
jgi:hypothetical protein